MSFNPPPPPPPPPPSQPQQHQPSSSSSTIPTGLPSHPPPSSSAITSNPLLPPLLQLPPAPPLSTGPPPLPPAQTFDFLPPLHVLIQKVLSDDLSPQDLSHHANPIRVKLQKARALVNELPDINRGLEEQMKEINELEERIKRQRETVGRAWQVVREVLAGEKGVEVGGTGRMGENGGVGSGEGDWGMAMETQE